MLNPLYKIKEENIAIGSYTVRLLRITNIDELFNELLKKDENSIEVKDERIPYWADLWPSSIALSRYMVENNKITKGAKVLEIGCGLGLPGAVAGMMGAEVTFTDYMPEPLEFAKKNWEMNNDRSAQFQLLDWRNDLNETNADIILASDVAYESRMFEPLMRFVKQACAQGKTILLSEPGRKFAKSFLEELYNNDLVRKAVEYTIKLNELDNRVTVYELRRIAPFTL